MTLIWSIWRIRNRIVFQLEAFDEEGCFELCLFDLAWWVKVEWGKSIFVNELYNSVSRKYRGAEEA